MGRDLSEDPAAEPVSRAAGEKIDSRTRIALYLIIYILCAATFAGLSDNYLFNDDFLWISEARYSMEPSNVLSKSVIGFFRPLVNCTFYLIERASPGNIPIQYRVNLALHVICSILVLHLFLSLRCGLFAAISGALLFAVTSVHSGAVLWISARTTLLSSALLLPAVILLSGGTGARAAPVALSGLLYALALAAKETAIAGLLIVALLWLLRRTGRLRAGLVLFTVISAIYLMGRTLFIGRFLQENWGFGPHMLRNVGGGFIYQLYPWPLFSLFYARGTHIAEPTHPFSPEILAIPLLLLLVAIGRATGRTRCYATAAGWSLIALLPSSLFTYRFFSTASITQNRYYYLSSVGSVLTIALLAGAIWERRGRAVKALAVALCALLAAGYMVRVHKLEEKMGEFTEMYREIITQLAEASDQFPGVTRVVVEEPPMAFRYLEAGLSLERPRLELAEGRGDPKDAGMERPYLLVTYSGDYPKIMRMEEIE